MPSAIGWDFVRDPDGSITQLYIPGATQHGCDISINDAGTIVSSFNTRGPVGLNNLDVITGYYTIGPLNAGNVGFILRGGRLGHHGHSKW
jgi:hypothetical protein